VAPCDHKIESVREYIDPNTATCASLRRLPGIGHSRAEAIIEYRNLHGPFGSRHDLAKVPGIGPVTVKNITGSIMIRTGAGNEARGR
jgi:competence ComEA-like helix-hairpin-helix protein